MLISLFNSESDLSSLPENVNFHTAFKIHFALFAGNFQVGAILFHSFEKVASFIAAKRR